MYDFFGFKALYQMMMKKILTSVIEFLDTCSVFKLVFALCVFYRNALNIVKDDLIAKLDELTG